MGGQYLSWSPFWGAREGCVCLLMGRADKKKEGVADQGPTSLFLFTPSSPVRRLTTWLIQTPLFEGTIIVTIIVNCLSMAMDHKLPSNDKTQLSNELVRQQFTLNQCILLKWQSILKEGYSDVRNLDYFIFSRPFFHFYKSIENYFIENTSPMRKHILNLLYHKLQLFIYQIKITIKFGISKRNVYKCEWRER